MKRLGFIHQYLLCGYIPDFAHLAGKLVIELDGNTHDPKADAYRDEVLRSRGWTTARFKNHEVWRNTQNFLTQVQALLQANMKETGFTRKLVGPQAQVPARSLN
jgi:very-short-patch-repair endonuclease